MKIKDLAIQNYQRFCALEGSDYIASEFALETIIRIIDKFKVKNILELGLGIGSISDTVFKYVMNKNGIDYSGTENNEFCLKSLKNNVIDYNKLNIFSELHQIKDVKFDLIIIDGYDDNLNKIKSYCKTNTIIFIEGDRKGQREVIFETFPKSKYVDVITLNKNKPYCHGEVNPNNYVGGGQLIFCNPTFKMNIFWFQQKIKTFIIYKVRSLNQ